MAEVLVLEFETPGAADLYHKVSGILNVDPETGSGDWPAPLKSHVAGTAGDKLVVVEVWESKAVHEEFMSSRLMPAFQEANVPAPIRAEWFSQVGGMHQQ